MKRMNTNILVTAALLVAAAIVLSRFLSINAWNLKVGFTFVPVFIAAYFYGPVMAGFVGGVADFLGAILFPVGAYFPGFTLTCALTGVVFGLLIHNKQTAIRIIAAIIINQLVLGLLVNTVWISILYGASFSALVVTRVIQCTIMIPIEFIMICTISKFLAQHRKELAL